jgi:hypothetical protein
VLVRIAKTNEKAALVLLKLCESENNARSLAVNDFWICQPLPSVLDTLKVLFSVLTYPDLRSIVSNSKSVVDLLKMAAEDGKLPVISMLSGVVKRLVLTRKRVLEFSNKGIWEGILKAANECDSEASDRAMFSVFETVAKIGYTGELLTVCDVAIAEVSNLGGLRYVAGNLIIELCKYEKCLERLKASEIVDVYEKGVKKTGDKRLVKQMQKIMESFDVESDV